MTKIKNNVYKSWIDLDVIIKYSIKNFECQCKKKQHIKMEITNNLIETKSFVFREYKQKWLG